jgi:hypothetical protein
MEEERPSRANMADEFGTSPVVIFALFVVKSSVRDLR